MSPFYRFLLTLAVLVLLACACQPATTPAPTALPPTSTPAPVVPTPTLPPSPTAPLPTAVPLPTATTIPTATAAPATPSALLRSSGDIIAYQHSSQIYLMSADGSAQEAVLGTSDAATLTWSADGKRLAYIIHHSDREWSIYVVDVGGNHSERLTQGQVDYYPRWSPDGSQLAFIRSGSVWVARISSDARPVLSDLRQLTNDPKECAWSLDWSPDGTQIVFGAQMGTPQGESAYDDPTTAEIYIIRADGSGRRRLTDNQAIDFWPGWSPDGKQIVFTSNRDGNPRYTIKDVFSSQGEGSFQIYTMSVDGQNVRRLTQTTANDFSPAWSPDGKRIAFASNRDGNFEIYTVNADGTRPTRLTQSSDADMYPTWRPLAKPQAVAPSPLLAWEKTYHKKSSDLGEDLIAAPDGGFYLVGTTGLDFESPTPAGDIYLLRTDAAGKVLWEKTYGGEKSEEGNSLTQMKDGSLLLGGTTTAGTGGGTDAYLVKVDPQGKELWSKSFGGPLNEMAQVSQLPDGSLMVWGNLVDPKDTVADAGAAGYSGYDGRSNIFLTRIDPDGKELWTRRFGDKNNLVTSSGVSTGDGGFVVLATLMRFPEPGDDLYLIKIDQNGNKVWERTWKDGTMSAQDLIRTSDGGYLAVGLYSSLNEAPLTKADCLWIKLDAQGNEQWLSTFGDPNMMDYPQVVAELPGGGYIAAGDWVKDWSGRYPPAVSVIRIDAAGKRLWQDVIQTGGQHTILRTMLRQPDGSALVVGSRMGQGQFDLLLMKINTADPAR